MYKIYRQQDNPLLMSFASEQNINKIHDELITRVYRNTGYKISRQSDRDLMGIMNSVYQEFGNTACGNQTTETLNAINRSN
jgi:hypothetical protein